MDVVIPFMLKSTKGMGLNSGLPPYLLLLGVSHLGLLAGLGITIWNQRQISEQLDGLSELVATHHRVEPGGGGPGKPDSGVSSAFDRGPRKSLEDVSRVETEWNSGSAAGFSLVGALVSTLTFLLAIGWWFNRRRQVVETEASPRSPGYHREVAQRQLAELRLRKYGFGQSRGVGGV